MVQMRITLTAELVWIIQCLQNTVWYNRVCYSCSQDILTLEEHQISANFQVVIQMAMYYEAHQPESLFCRMTKRFSFPFQSRETKWVRKWKVFFWCWILHSDAEVADSPIRGKLLGCVYFTVKLGTQNPVTFVHLQPFASCWEPGFHWALFLWQQILHPQTLCGRWH